MSPKPSLRSIFALFGSSLLAMSSANAATYYWDGTSATWNDFANWSTVIGATTPDPGALPLVTDDLIFNITGANSLQNIALDANQAARSLTFNTTGATNFRANSSGTDARILTLGAGGITLAATAGPVTIGEAPGTYGAVNITMSAAQTWTNSSSSLLSITGNVNNGGNLLTIGSTSTHIGPISIGGVISGSGGITVTSKTRLVLSGANEFTGAITVNGFTDTGTIAFTSIADYGVASALGKAASGSISLGNGGSEGRLEYIGTTNMESNRTISIKGTSVTAGQIYNNGTGTLTFDATTFNTVNGSGNRFLILDGSNTGNNTISGAIINNTGGTLALTKSGAGTWVLGGNSSYTGATTISGGTLSVSTLADAGSASNLGAFAAAGAGGIFLSGGTLQYTGASVSVNRGFTLAANSTVDVSTASTALTLGASSLGGFALNVTGGSGSSLSLGALTLTGAPALNSNVNLTVASVTGATRNLVLRGTASGSVVTGAIATTTGTITKQGTGTWVLKGANSNTGATGISGGGTLVLDYGSGQDNSKIGNTDLTLQGGGLVLRGGTHAQAVTNINYYANAYSSISREAGSTATLVASGNIQANGSGQTSSTLWISEGGIVGTTNGNVNGILGVGKITVGSDFATNISNLVQAYTDYTPIILAGTGGGATVTNLLTGGGATSATLNSYALKIVNDATNNTLTLGSGRDLTIANSSTLLYAGTAGQSYTIDGSATSEVRTSTGSGFHINVAGGTLTVNTTLGNAGDTILVKTGAGTLVVGGAYVGSNNTPPVVIQQGVLRVANSAGLGSTNAATTVQIGSALELSQTTGGSPADITIGAEALTLNGSGIADGGALRNHSGSNTYGGLITIGGGGARINSNVSTSLTLTGGIATASGNSVTFGGLGNTTVATTAITGAGGLIKDGLGTTTLSATNAYTGNTTVSDGKLIVNGNISSSTLTTVASGATLGGSGTVGKTTVLAGGTLSPGNSPGTMTYTDTLALEGNVLMEIDGTVGAGVTDGHDFINLTGAGAAGALTYGGTMTLDMGFIFGAGSYTWNLFDMVSETGTFTGITLADKYSGSLLDADLNGVWDLTSGTNTWQFTESTGVLDLTVAVIPEPKAALLGAVGLLLLLRRRRQD